MKCNERKRNLHMPNEACTTDDKQNNDATWQNRVVVHGLSKETSVWCLPQRAFTIQLPRRSIYTELPSIVKSKSRRVSPKIDVAC